ncbi:antirestriction protein [Bacteriophage sp.]|nr:antirestriction protein [Bacteriophage sp.]
MNKQDIATTITNEVIKQLEQGCAPWVKPWKSKPSEGAPHNPASGTYYRGANFIWLTLLQSSGAFGTSSEWMTYKQAQDKGAQVRKGAKGVQVIFYKPMQVQGAFNPDTQQHDSKVIPMIKTYTVFNRDMIDGLPVDEVAENEPSIPEFQTKEECETFIKDSGAIVKHGGDSAFYSPSLDFIQLPKREDFKSESDYYATALHELSHWTGHKSRIDRDFSKSKRWGDSAYAFEELVAELGAAMLCAHLKVDGQLQHASYIQSWLKVLKQDSKAILKAGAEAQKILDYLVKVEEVEAAEDELKAA